jgi:transcriptional regulator with XRE-family HTH domain
MAARRPTRQDRLARQLGTRIRQARLTCGLSGKALAAQIGYSRNALTEVECGRTTPRVTTLMDIAHALHVSAAWLLGEQDERGDDIPDRQAAVPRRARGRYVDRRSIRRVALRLAQLSMVLTQAIQTSKTP